MKLLGNLRAITQCVTWEIFCLLLPTYSSVSQTIHCGALGCRGTLTGVPWDFPQWPLLTALLETIVLDRARPLETWVPPSWTVQDFM